MKKTFIFLFLCACICSQKARAQMTVRVVKDSLFIPWEIIYGPDGKIWFDQKSGYVCRIDPATGITDTIYHQPNVVVHSEGGMVGMALHPSFPATPYIYITYEYLDGNNNYWERVSRFTYNGTTLTNEQVLIDSVEGAIYHNGSRLLIVGDKLFISTGDATIGSNAQDLNIKNGKILRLNLDGSIPSDNPLANSPIWCWGQRNPQGLVYANNRLYSSMHGDATDDEINIIMKGRNYGWPTVQGYCDQPSEMAFCADSNVVEPIHAWTPTIAPSGIDYYTQPMFPQWQNSLLLCSLKDTTLHQLQLNATFDSVISDTRILLHYGRLRDICISPDGKVYISTSNSDANNTGQHIDKILEIYDPSYTGVAPVSKAITTLYPNPATSEVTLITPQISNGAYIITNTLGRQVLSGSLKSNKTIISVKQLPQGIYTLKATGSTGYIWTGKLSKQ